MAEDPLAREQVLELLHELSALRDALREAERAHRVELEAMPRESRLGATNLVHYVTFRKYDVRPLQEKLAAIGLSSLGRSEARIEDAITTVMRVLAQLAGESYEAPPTREAAYAQGKLRENTRALLGDGDGSIVMVTMPSEAADDRALVRELISAGMRVARINCAHDDEQAWRSMAAHVRSASAELDRPCRVLFDLPGPKLRTLPLAKHEEITLTRGDTLVLTGDGEPGRAARHHKDGRLIEPARIACALPQAVAALVPGACVYFDDGKIAARVVEVNESGALLAITRAGRGKAKLKAEKGINLPDTPLTIAALGRDDRRALDVAVECADMVGLSFVRTREDVQALVKELDERKARLGVVLKIETKLGFEQLPTLLLAGLGRPPLGVMIARGDLAVECGFERMAELQEEILWLCEAAHVPCIWATQVLETLAKKGKLTRAEITDAAAAERAECVMLNKGPHVVRAVKTLRNILTRMRGHQQKKTAVLRPLRSPQLEALVEDPKAETRDYG